MENSLAVKKPRKGLSKLKKRQEICAYLFILPLLFVFIVFILIPLIMSFYLSFTDYNMAHRMNWVGLDNYKFVLRDSKFMQSFLNAGLYVLMYVPVVVVSGVIVAALLNSKIKFKNTFKAIYYIPAITSAIAIGYVWSWLMHPNYGLFNQFLAIFDVAPLGWHTDPKTALLSIVIVSSWGALGGNTLIFLAAYKGIPDTYYEAAEIDGAGPLRRFFSISLPLIQPTIYFIFTMALIGSFQLFDLVLMLTNGSPETITPVYYIYQVAWVEIKGGIAAVMGVVLFFFIMIITFITQRFMKESST